jgi:hypothetical protein
MFSVILLCVPREQCHFKNPTDGRRWIIQIRPSAGD